MSTNYRVHCLDCGAEHDLQTDRRLEACRMLVLHADKLADMAELFAIFNDSSAPMSFTWELRLEMAGDTLWPAWFATHRGHRLITADEYGHHDDECGAWANCTLCPHAHTFCCRLPKDHAGEHAKDRPDGGK